MIDDEDAYEDAYNAYAEAMERQAYAEYLDAMGRAYQ